MLRRLAAIAIGVLGLLAGPGPAGHAAAAADLALGYEAWKGGLYVMRIDAALHRDARAYRIVMTAGTDGLIGWLFPYRLETRTQGLADGDGVAPQRFEVTAHEGGATKRRGLLFRPDGGLDVTESPPEAARIRCAAGGPPAWPDRPGERVTGARRALRPRRPLRRPRRSLRRPPALRSGARRSRRGNPWAERLQPLRGVGPALPRHRDALERVP